MASPKRIEPHDLLLVMGGTEERLQLVLGQPGPDGCKLLTSRQWNVPGQSIRFLIPGLEQTLNSFGLGVDVIAKIACVRGPGSFTGLRLILAAAEGLAAGQELPLAGLDYLPLLASGPASLINGTLHVLTYARRGLVYLQSFDAPNLTAHAPLESLSLKDAALRMASFGDQAYLMGSGLRKNPDFFNELLVTNPGYVLLDKQWDNPSPDTLLAAAYAAEFTHDSIEPVYVRPTDAEDNLDTIAVKQGLDPAEAKKRLHKLRRQ
nr:tRNA (adenosine(37)-N6)-threonylcarbamoyltransferase complex dimerization subunit type 1 TsaB [uncultured Pseudodesulfovibrio sp.]